MVALSERDDRTVFEKIRLMRWENAESDDSTWHLYGSDIEDYNQTFKPVLDGNKLEDIISEKTFPTVVDLMGPSDSLASLLAKFPEVNTRGVAVTLQDLRDKDKKARDESLDITQISGDITRGNTWNEINRALDGRKATLIVERAVAPLDYFPLHEAILIPLISRAWKILDSDYGIMLLQTPRHKDIINSGVRETEWFRMLAHQGVKVESYYPFRERGAIKIVKTPWAPKELPLLPRNR